jgi:hypothetical protein
MKAGDLVKFTGTWGPSVIGISPPEVGVIIQLWTNGRTKLLQRIDVLWDNGDIRQVSECLLEVISESR